MERFSLPALTWDETIVERIADSFVRCVLVNGSIIAVGRVLLTITLGIITSNYHALSIYLRNLLVHIIECVFSIRSTD